MPAIFDEKHICNGCGACANICPRDAISMGNDNDGYLKAKVNSNKCINCAICMEVCPTRNGAKRKEDYSFSCYAAWGEKELRQKSSSGGVFSILSNAVLKNNGSVFGAAWDDSLHCIISEINDYKSIDLLRRSKYVQSRTNYSFRKVRERLKEGKMVLYSGLPCQIAGLNSYFSKTEDSLENFLSVDLFCYHAPANEYLVNHMNYLYGAGNVKEVNFRAKEIDGWHPKGYEVLLKNGNREYISLNDEFIQAFHGLFMCREVCNQCVFAGIPRQADISLGDFWDIDFIDQSWNDGYGTSIVLANTEKGEKWIRDSWGSFSRIEEKKEYIPQLKQKLAMRKKRGNTPEQSLFFGNIKKMSFENAVKSVLEYQSRSDGAI